MTVPAQDNTVLPQDFSITLTGSAQSPLAANYPAAPASGTYPSRSYGAAGTNPYRTFLQFQAPHSVPITYSFTNSSPNDPAGTMAVGCFYLAGGAFSPQWSLIPQQPLYVNGGSGGTGLVMAILEC